MHDKVFSPGMKFHDVITNDGYLSGTADPGVIVGSSSIINTLVKGSHTKTGLGYAVFYDDTPEWYNPTEQRLHAYKRVVGKKRHPYDSQLLRDILGG